MCYSIIISGACLALGLVAITRGDSSPANASVLDCHAPADNPSDMPSLPTALPTPLPTSVWWPQPCTAAPRGLTLLCEDLQPREHLRDCGKIVANPNALYNPDADPCAPPTDMPPDERAGWIAFCKANHPPTETP
jgi:hypothetical protein